MTVKSILQSFKHTERQEIEILKLFFIKLKLQLHDKNEATHHKEMRKRDPALA